MIRICDDDAFAKMCEVEGPDYEENQRGFGDYSFDAFRAQWLKVSPWWRVHFGDLPELQEDMDRLDAVWRRWRDSHGHCVPLKALSVGSAAVIYGWHGWNRYVVRSRDGAVLFHRHAAVSEEALKKAQEVGFGIFPDDMGKM